MTISSMSISVVTSSTNGNIYKLRNGILNEDENLQNLQMILDIFLGLRARDRSNGVMTSVRFFTEMENYLTFFFTSYINLDYMFCNWIKMLKFSTEVKSNVYFDMDKTVLYEYGNFFVVCSETSSRFVVFKMIQFYFHL